MNEYKECEGMTTDNDDSGQQEDGKESKVTPASSPSSVYCNRQTHTAGSEKSIAATKEEEHSDAVLQSLGEVTVSRKPIKKMINIHVGDAVSTHRWDGLTIVLRTHIYDESNEQCSPACCNFGVLGGADQEVNMIQSSSFISLMKVRTAERYDRQFDENYLPTAGLQCL